MKYLDNSSWHSHVTDSATLVRDDRQLKSAIERYKISIPEIRNKIWEENDISGSDIDEVYGMILEFGRGTHGIRLRDALSPPRPNNIRDEERLIEHG